MNHNDDKTIKTVKFKTMKLHSRLSNQWIHKEKFTKTYKEEHIDTHNPFEIKETKTTQKKAKKSKVTSKKNDEGFNPFDF